MSKPFAALEKQLCEQFADAERGPTRNGLFAVWLVLRLAGDVLPPHTVTERAHRRRSEAMEKRLTSLTLPPALRTPLHEATANLADRSSVDLGKVLQTLVPVVKDTLGKQAAAAVSRAVSLASRPEVESRRARR